MNKINALTVGAYLLTGMLGVGVKMTKGCSGCRFHSVKMIEKAKCNKGRQLAMERWFDENKLKNDYDDIGDMPCREKVTPIDEIRS